MATRQELIEKAEKLEREARSLRDAAATLYEYPREPHWRYATIVVKHRGNTYPTDYIVEQDGNGRWVAYSNTTHPTKSFRDWEALVDWLRDDDVVNCGDLRRLMHDGSTVRVP